MAEENVKAVIEALLFSAENPITLEQLKDVLDGYQTDALRRMVEEIKSDYANNNRGMRISEVAGGFQMVTASNFAPFLKKFYKARRAERLSKPALETLAIVAYKQPVTKSEIESLRNVNLDGVIGHLLHKNLIRTAGRRKAPGRPFVYGTTRQFLEYFGLKSLEELPKIESLAILNNKREGNNESKEAAPKD